MLELIGDWVASLTDAPLLDSVRAALEAALAHAMAQLVGVPLVQLLAAAVAGAGGDGGGGTIVSPVLVNGLADRSTDGPAVAPSPVAHEAQVTKVKVGGRRVAEDAQRVTSLLQIIAAGGTPHRARIDANQAWSSDEAAAFWDGIPEALRGLVDYVEEPLASPTAAQLAELHRSTAMPLALDESLYQGTVTLDELDSVAGLAALVLKPAVLGASRTVALVAAARRLAVDAVVSAMFDGEVGLAHSVLLAAVCPDTTTTPTPGLKERPRIQHGLSTFRHLADRRQSFDRRVVVSDARGWLSTLGSAAELDDLAASHTWPWRREPQQF